MQPPHDFTLGDLFNQIAQFTDRLEQASQSLESTKHRELYQRIVADLRLAKGKADELFPEIGKQLKDICEQQYQLTEETLTKIRSELASLEQSAPAAAKSAAAAAVKTSVPAIDPKLGMQLRDELLQRMFPGQTASERPLSSGKDIWEDWK